MSFFGPGTLSGYSPSTTSSGLDPQVVQQLVAQFPGLQSMGQGQGAGQSLASLGYSYPGPQLFSGQGTGSLQLSPFESAGGASPESITGGLAMGTFGKSSSQQPAGGGSAGFGNLSLPSLQLPMAQVASSQAADSGDTGGLGSTAGAPSAGSGLGALGSVADTGGSILNFLTGQGQTTGPQTPGMPQQRADERVDYSNATGSPGGIPQLPSINTAAGNAPFNTPLPSFDMSQAEFLNMGNQHMPPLQLSPLQGGDLLTAPTSNTPLTSNMPTGDTTMTAPGGSAQFSLGGPDANYFGAAQNAFSTLSGGLNLFGGIQSGSPLSASMGGLQAIGGVTGLLQNLPGLADKLGIGGGALNEVGGAVQSITGGYSLYQGIQSGDPMQIAGGLTSLYGGASQLVNQVAGTELMPALTDLAIQAVTAVSPAAGQALGQAISSVGSVATAWAGPIAAVVTAVLDSMAELDRERVQQSGFMNNPIKGALYSASTAGVGSAQGLLDKIQQMGGAGQVSTADLATALAQGVNDLMPYYATAEGGTGPIRASDTLTGGSGMSKSTASGGLGGAEAYSLKEQQAAAGIRSLVDELMKRGVTYEQLGQIPVTGGYTQQSLDAYNPINDLYAQGAAKYDPQAQQMLNSLLNASKTEVPLTNEYGSPTGQTQTQYMMQGHPIDPATLTPQALFHAAQGQAAIAPDMPGNSQSGLITSMYGGPLWAAMARTLSPADPLQQQIAQHFNPWSAIGNFTPQQMFAALNPNIGPLDLSNTPAAAPATPNWWQQQVDQQSQQRAAQDPMVLALQQYQQQLGQLQGQLPQLNQAAGTMSQQGLDPQLMAALQAAPGFSGGNGQFNPSGGGGIDLQALLRQLGYTA